MNTINKILCISIVLVLCSSCSLDDGQEAIDPPNFAVLGLWDLVEVNVSEAQDINMDGTASTNLMDELDCISGTLLIDGDLVWTYEQTAITITPITNNQYAISCSDAISATGTWFSDENEVTFAGNDVLSTLEIDGQQLINESGEDLPGILSYIYELRQN
ncbi:hypothetical protein LV716_16550 [Flagellimonas sp. HMM57]|uniref:hypothetical protein n=1 Tax=unclassified Flagellimonas TaxID=2644544 RepID=UPI0013D5CEFC|nr:MULTISPECIES: hypothetical protein [unclassified Flagellimonas]UII75853.1 hypothetical protein LV716_16550 [Flagellimonas sp. HMM57]